jgi:hypothetical protein
MDAAEEAVATSGPTVDPMAEVVCASLPLACCRGAALTSCTRCSRKRTDDEVADGCARRPLAAE